MSVTVSMLYDDGEALCLARDFSRSIAAWRMAHAPASGPNTILLPPQPQTRWAQGFIALVLALANAVMIGIALGPCLA